MHLSTSKFILNDEGMFNAVISLGITIEGQLIPEGVVLLAEGVSPLLPVFG